MVTISRHAYNGVFDERSATVVKLQSYKDVNALVSSYEPGRLECEYVSETGKYRYS